MQFNIFEQPTTSNLTEELFCAYFDCRKNKRNIINALAFEKNFESNLFSLKDQIVEGTYNPGHSIAFIVNKPVKREIFATDFRDRVVHHFIINKLNPFFENYFINDSYACRVGKGTHFEINRVDNFIKECSGNYSRDCYILKHDIQGFFMHINRNILFDGLFSFIEKHYKAADKDILASLCRKVVFNHPAGNCMIKGKKSDWDGLPRNKSLFYSPAGCGLPIGNLTSQVFANFYMDAFDKYIKQQLDIKYYDRYVDNFVIIHENKQYLLLLVNEISAFLHEKLKLRLHPNKICIQHFSKGVQYLGAIIKPHRIYIANRTKGNFFEAIEKQNAVVRKGKPSKEDKDVFLSCMNSYLGIMSPCKASQNGIHYKTYKLRKKMINKHLSGWWGNHVYPVKYSKFVFKVRRVKERDKINLL